MIQNLVQKIKGQSPTTEDQLPKLQGEVVVFVDSVEVARAKNLVTNKGKEAIMRWIANAPPGIGASQAQNDWRNDQSPTAPMDVEIGTSSVATIATDNALKNKIDNTTISSFLSTPTANSVQISCDLLRPGGAANIREIGFFCNNATADGTAESRWGMFSRVVLPNAISFTDAQIFSVIYTINI